MTFDPSPAPLPSVSMGESWGRFTPGVETREELVGLPGRQQPVGWWAEKMGGERGEGERWAWGQLEDRDLRGVEERWLQSHDWHLRIT